MATNLAPTRCGTLRHALPGFLVPAWQQQQQQQQQQYGTMGGGGVGQREGSRRRSHRIWQGQTQTMARQQQQQQQESCFSTTTQVQSKLGRAALTIPPGVELVHGAPLVRKSMTSFRTTTRKIVSVKGPLGTLDLEFPEFVNLSEDAESRQLRVSVLDSSVKQQREMWGTTWAYMRNYITGVSEGHSAILRLVGVGYRATVEPRGGKQEFPGQLFLCLKLGFTHPIEVGIPREVKATTPAPTRILLEGVDREAIMSFAGKVRLLRPPEPYKGKGIFVNDETIKLKSKIK